MSGTRGYHKERPGPSVPIKTDQNVENVRTLARRDRRLGIGMIPEEVRMDKETVIQKLTVSFIMWNVCARKWAQRI
jgi:hypothetical protein